MPKQRTPKKSEPTNPHAPDREDVEAELPQAPAREPLGGPTPIGSERAPRPTIEAEDE
jgi:hypothetical protein